MEITGVRVSPVNEEKLKAYVSIVIDHCFMVNDVKVIDGRDGLFISMPSRRRPGGGYRDIAHPLNSETRNAVQTAVLEAYRLRLDGGEEGGSDVVNPEEKAASARSPRSGSDRKSPADGHCDDDLGTTLEEIQQRHLQDSFWSV